MWAHGLSYLGSLLRRDRELVSTRRLGTRAPRYLLFQLGRSTPWGLGCRAEAAQRPHLFSMERVGALVVVDQSTCSRVDEVGWVPNSRATSSGRIGPEVRRFTSATIGSRV